MVNKVILKVLVEHSEENHKKIKHNLWPAMNQTHTYMKQINYEKALSYLGMFHINLEVRNEQPVHFN